MWTVYEVNQHFRANANRRRLKSFRTEAAACGYADWWRGLSRHGHGPIYCAVLPESGSPDVEA